MPRRADVRAWTEQTESGHEAYRGAHPIPEGRAAIVCVSMRPHMLDAVVANVVRQRDVDADVVFVANSAEFDVPTVERSFAALASVSVLHPRAQTSLGAALNLAMDSTDARFIAKFDDDDLYGPMYLADSLRAHGYAGAGVVGKHSYYSRLVATDVTILRFPCNEFRYSGTLAGGTLVLDRDRVGDQRFDDVSLGEDRAFLARCHRRGISTYSADRFNFLQMRTGSNTWAIDDATFVEQSTPVDASTVIDR